MTANATNQAAVPAERKQAGRGGFFAFPKLQRAMMESVESRMNAVGDLKEGINQGVYRLGQNGLELGRLFEALYGFTTSEFLRNESGVRQAIAASGIKESVGSGLMESAGGVTMSDFKLLSTQLITKEIKDAPKNPALISDELYRVEPSDPRPNSQNMPWIGGPTRWADVTIKELEPFPPVAPQNGLINYAPQEKKGALVPFSKEALLTRNSQWIIRSGQNARDGGLIRRNINMLKVVAGTTGKWKFAKNDGAYTEYNTYNPSAVAPYVKNSLSSIPLNSWTDIDTALQAFRDMVDPVSGEFIAIPLNLTLLVPMCIFAKANVIKNAVVTTNYNAAIASATIRYEGPNPLNYVYPGMQLTILGSQYFDEITGSTSSTYTWYVGDFKEAFANDQVWGPTFDELSDGGESSFWRDMNLVLKLSWMESYVVYNNTQVLKIANT